MNLHMLPDSYAPHKITYPCLVQPYVNGQRVFYQAGWFETENGASLEGNYNWLTKPLTDVFAPGIILDGVLKNRTFFVFDIVGRIAYKKRFDAVCQVLRDSHCNPTHILPIATRKVFNERQANDQFEMWTVPSEDCIQFTGMIYRLGNCPYTKPTPKNKLNVSKQLLLRKCENSTPAPTSAKAIESKSPSTPRTNHAGFSMAL